MESSARLGGFRALKKDHRGAASLLPKSESIARLCSTSTAGLRVPRCEMGMGMYHVSIGNEQLKFLDTIPIAAKFGGATGNFNAHHVAFPKIDWKEFGTSLINELGLHHSYPTTQIEHYDHLASLFDCLKRINTIIG